MISHHITHDISPLRELGCSMSLSSVQKEWYLPSRWIEFETHQRDYHFLAQQVWEWSGSEITHPIVDTPKTRPSTNVNETSHNHISLTFWNCSIISFFFISNFLSSPLNCKLCFRNCSAYNWRHETKEYYSIIRSVWKKG